MVRPLSATALATACLIHQVAYVEEAEALPGIEFVHGLHQPNVSLLDEVLEGQPHPPVSLGHADHQTKVPLDESLSGAFVSRFGESGKLCLLAVRQQLLLAYAIEVPLQQRGRFVLMELFAASD